MGKKARRLRAPIELLERRVLLTAAVNDLFADAVLLSGTSASDTSDNTDATKETGEPRHAGNNGGASLWWSWTSPGDSRVTIDTVGSALDTILGVYTGSSVSTLSGVASNDDAVGS